MREILFRGKRVDNGEWVYGYPLVDTAPCSLKKKGHCECAHDGSDAAIFAWVDNLHEYDDFDVAPETVGQYTGLTDKNGKKIFEGDIVRHYNYSNNPELFGIGLVFWDEKSCKFMRTVDRQWMGTEYISRDVETATINSDCLYEVIGNIHDNPELLTEATP